MKPIDIMFILCLLMCAGVIFLGWITDKRMAARDELLRRTRLERDALRKRVGRQRAELRSLGRYLAKATKNLPPGSLP